MATLVIMTVSMIAVIVFVVAALAYVSDADEDDDWIDHE